MVIKVIHQGVPKSMLYKDVEYRDIPGFPGYRVGDDGSVWSCRNNRGVTSKWRRRKPEVGQTGYLCVKLRANARATNLRVHSLVLTAFVGPRPAGMQGCHNNGDPTDCRLTNLRWDTPAANGQDAVRHGRSTRGAKNRHVKLTAAIVRSIRRRAKAGESAVTIAKDVQVSTHHCRAVIRGRFWGWLTDEEPTEEVAGEATAADVTFRPKADYDRLKKAGEK